MTTYPSVLTKRIESRDNDVDIISFGEDRGSASVVRDGAVGRLSPFSFHMLIMPKFNTLYGIVHKYTMVCVAHSGMAGHGHASYHFRSSCRPLFRSAAAGDHDQNPVSGVLSFTMSVD